MRADVTRTAPPRRGASVGTDVSLVEGSITTVSDAERILEVRRACGRW